MFNAIVLTVATFDIIPAGDLIKKVFEFADDKPFSDTFDAYGISNTQFMLSMGSAFVIYFGSLMIFPLL